MHNVLLQQEKSLLDLQGCLDPSSSSIPTFGRKFQFEWETRRIEGIIGHVRDQMMSCQRLEKKTTDMLLRLEPLSSRSFTLNNAEVVAKGLKRLTQAGSRGFGGFGRTLSKENYSASRKLQQQTFDEEEIHQSYLLRRRRSSKISSRSVREELEHEIRSVKIQDESGRPKVLDSLASEFLEKLAAVERHKVRLAALDLLWENFPQIDHVHLEGKVGNFEDPGDGLFYDEENVRNASSVLNDLCLAWKSLGDEVASSCPIGLSQMAKICLILNGMQQASLLDNFIDGGIVDSDLPLSPSRLESILKGPKGVYTQVFVAEQYRAVPRHWPEGGHIDLLEAEPLPLVYEWTYSQGSYGSVFRVRDSFSKEVYALKRQIMLSNEFLNSDAQNHLRREAENLRRLTHHKHIVRLVKTYQRGSTFGLVLVPAATADLEKLLARFKMGKFDAFKGLKDSIWLRPDLMRGFGCLSVALRHMHDRNLRHGDIKPSNILYERSHAKNESARLLLADFGLAHDFSETHKSDRGSMHVYTKRYAAPELFRWNDSNSQHGQASDVFSLGCVFFEILAALKNTKLPLDIAERHKGHDKAKSLGFSGQIDELISWTKSLTNTGGLGPLFVLAANMIQPRSNDRPTMNQVVEKISEAGPEYFCSSCQLGLSPQDESFVLAYLPKLKVNTMQSSNSLPEVEPATALKHPSDSPEMEVRGLVQLASTSSGHDRPNLLPSSLQDIEEIMSARLSNSSTGHTVRFLLHWDPIQYIKEELADSSTRSQRELLRTSLAVTGTAETAYAATISDYLKWKWPHQSAGTIQLILDSVEAFRKGKLISPSPDPVSISFLSLFFRVVVSVSYLGKGSCILLV